MTCCPYELNYIFSSSVWTLKITCIFCKFPLCYKMKYGMPLIFWLPCTRSYLSEKDRQVEICKHKYVSFVFSVWNQCCFLSCAYDVPVCSFYPTVYRMNVIDVNIFNVSTRDVQSCVVSALEVYSIVYILLNFFVADGYP